MKKCHLIFFIRLLLSLDASVISVQAIADVQFKGTNLSGGEYAGCEKVGARYGYDYIYSSTADIDAFIALGVNTFRLPFCWERIQPTLQTPLDATELARIDELVAHITSSGAYVVLDLHNYAAYRNISLAAAGFSKEALADIWRRLGTKYRGNDHVIFGLMNEPHGLTSELWLTAANAAMAGIRGSGAKNLVLVPGVAWTGAYSWTSSSYGTPNAVTMLGVQDASNNYAYEVHQYLDSNSSGTAATCVDGNIGVSRIAAFTTWARANHVKGFLGEFAGGRNDTCYTAVANMLDNIKANADVWIGWTYWSNGPWQSNYMFNIPTQIVGGQKTQLDVLRPFFSCATASCLPAPPTIKGVQQLKK